MCVQDEEGRDSLSGGCAVEETHPGVVFHWQRPCPCTQTQRRHVGLRGHEERFLPGPTCTYPGQKVLHFVLYVIINFIIDSSLDFFLFVS